MADIRHTAKECTVVALSMAAACMDISDIGCIPLTDDMGVFMLLQSFTFLAEAARSVLSALGFQERLVH